MKQKTFSLIIFYYFFILLAYLSSLPFSQSKAKELSIQKVLAVSSSKHSFILSIGSKNKINKFKIATISKTNISFKAKVIELTQEQSLWEIMSKTLIFPFKVGDSIHLKF